jgi:hypothetical protein
MDTGPVLALEPLSTILPGNYRHLQHAPGLGQADTVPRRKGNPGRIPVLGITPQARIALG